MIMDLLSLEHYFGKEIETSLQQLFIYFCNNVNLGQWQAAKACLKQLDANKKSFKIDFSSFLNDIIENPELYCHGSLNLQSPYHLALLLYEYCADNDYIINRDERFYDRILFKFIIYSISDEAIFQTSASNEPISRHENSSELADNLLDNFKPNQNAQLKNFADDLIDLVRNELFNAGSNGKEKSLSLSSASIEKLSSYSLNSLTTASLSSSITDSMTKETNELSQTTIESLKELLIKNPIKIKQLFELIVKYNQKSEKLILGVHLLALNKIIDNLDSQIDTLSQLLNVLSIYNIDKLPSNEPKVQMVQKMFVSLCMRINELYSENNIEKMDECYRELSVSFLSDEKKSNNNLLDLLFKTQYEVEIKMIVQSTFNDFNLPILSMIKKFSNMQKSNETYLWRMLFLHCYVENKLLIKSLIDECFLLIAKNQFDNLTLIFTVKEFLNLKPLILLTGICKVQDINSAKKLISSLCLSSEKGSLIVKIGNLLKTHLDFLTWYYQIKAEHHKKEINFNDLMKLLHRQLPLNILSQYVDITKIEYSEMTKILRNTLSEKESGEKTKWVRFVDEVNEKITQVQETCLAIYNGFYCINEVLNTILYSCENFNRRFLNETTRSRSSTAEPDAAGSHLEKLQSDYTKNVIDKLNSIKKLINQTTPLNYRLEILENIYSLIYLSCNDLKDEDEDDENPDENNENLNCDENEEVTNLKNLKKLNNNNNNNRAFFDLNDDGQIVDITLSKSDEIGASIYNSNPANSRMLIESANHSSKSTLGSFCSRESKGKRSDGYDVDNDVDDDAARRNAVYRQNAGGGGSFLVNDFLCRDILLMVKELLMPLNKSMRNNSVDDSQFLTRSRELTVRSSKLSQLVNESLWRFQLVKSEPVSIEFGHVALQTFDYNSPGCRNEKQELLVYEMMKKRRRALSSPASIELPGSKKRSETINSTGSTKGQRKSAESLRSLSLVYNLNKPRKSNMTVMKLLADVDTLAALCLKEAKFTEANQLVKMYPSNRSFECRQILYTTVYQQTLHNLQKLSAKLEKGLTEPAPSIELDKLVQSLLSFEKNNSLLQAILICDVILTLNICLELSSELGDYARSKINSLTCKEEEEECVSNADLQKFNTEYRFILSTFIDACQQVSNRLNTSSPLDSLADFFANFEGISLKLNSPNTDAIKTSIDKYLSFDEFKRNLDSLCETFYSKNIQHENEAPLQLKKHETYQSIIKLISQSINFSESDDLISTFLYRSNPENVKQKTSYDLTMSSEFSANSVERLLQRRLSSQDTKASNYLLSFYEYCKTLHDYFKEKSVTESITTTVPATVPTESTMTVDQNDASYFSILNSSPASLICKLLFEDSIKPQIIESLTQKLNLNLTAIILHNSCPRLKLAHKNKNPVLLPNTSTSSSSSSAASHLTEANQAKTQPVENDEVLIMKSGASDVLTYSLNSFYTILNESDIVYCSRKKPDEFVRDLLFKVLKFCKRYLLNREERHASTKKTNSTPVFVTNVMKKRTVDLRLAQKMYQSAEFKSILNESQELQHLNLHYLKNDRQKLCFFINLHNLLCIHSHFYLASMKRTSNACIVNDDSWSENLFQNETERLLFKHRMCYKVGQMGCVSLYDLKYLILMRCFLKDTTNLPQNTTFHHANSGVASQQKTTTTTTPAPDSKSSKSKSKSKQKSSSISSIKTEPKPVAKQAEPHSEPLFKYAFYKLNMDAEALWRSFLPGESACDYRVLFALTNFIESDPAICVYNSDSLLNDQLQIQMNMFLNDSVHADAETLYIPNFLVENFAMFTTNSNNLNDLESLIMFLIENVNDGLKEKLKNLLELNSTESFDAENIDQFGRRELSFPIERIAESKQSALIIEGNYESGASPSAWSWYRREINRRAKPLDKTEPNNDDLKKSQSSAFELKMEALSECFNCSRQLLNKGCLDYIQKNSPLITNSLSFLFDPEKREEFFAQLSDNAEFTDGGNSLNRFVKLYVPLDFMKHLSTPTKLDLITQFLLTNKTDESKIELIIDLANYYAQKQEWNLVLSLLNDCMQDNEELNQMRSATDTNSEAIDYEYGEEARGLKQIEQCQNGRYSQKDLYNLYDHACVCLAYQEAKQNHKSFIHLFKMKNFLRQTRAIFGLMHLWPIDGCLELVDFCLTKSKLYEQPTSNNNNNTLSTTETSQVEQPLSTHAILVNILNKKKVELTAYKELTKCAEQTLQKYYEHQQNQDAAGYYDNQRPIEAEQNNLSKMKRVCQRCLTWQFAKHQLESTSRDDEETNELIMDLFLLNDQFNSAKYLIKKFSLSAKLQFKLDFGHLKHRLLNLNASSSIIVIDLDAILSECIEFESANSAQEGSTYVFDICFRLLNELKDLRELNNQVLISLSELILKNYRSLLNETQTNELKTLQLTAKIFQVLLQELGAWFDSYKRHHSSPLLIIEQLLMNSHIDLCAKTVKMCRELIGDSELHEKINQTLVKYAKKALEFKVYPSNNNESQSQEQAKSRSPQTVGQSLTKINKQRRAGTPIEVSTSLSSSSIAFQQSSPNNHSLSSSFKTLYKFNPVISPHSNLASQTNNSFVMPAQPPSKDDWIKDEEVNECMVCAVRFSLLNRRHHCRRCGRVVCLICSQHETLVENGMKRTCDDCYRQIEQQKIKEQKKLDEIETSTFWLKKTHKLFKNNKSAPEMNNSSHSSSGIGLNTSAEHDELVVWQLIGGSDNETSQKRDEEIRASFKYNQAPSTSLCLSILNLHNQPLECGKALLSMCDDLSSNYLQTGSYQQVEDYSLVINMMKHLLHNAKVKLLQNSSTNIISLCDTYLSLIDVLEELLLANCSHIPSLYELRTMDLARRVRNNLLEEERHELAMNLSTKCGIDTQKVWASWGLTELRRGNYRDARIKFDRCLRPISDKKAAIANQTHLKILNDVVSFLESATPIRITGPQTLLAPLRNLDSLLAELKLYCDDESNMDDIQLTECVYYLETYGNHLMLIAFYQRHGFIEKALAYVIEFKCEPEVFEESLLVPCLRAGQFNQLLTYMLSLDKYQTRLYSYYAAIGKYLQKNNFINTLYDFQLQMKDYARACISCLFFFTLKCSNYADLYANMSYLTRARKHLEQYQEIGLFKQNTAQHSQHQSNHFVWKNKQETPTLIKLLTEKEYIKNLNAINLQIDVTKFIYNCMQTKREQIMSQRAPTLFSSDNTKISLCCLISLSGNSIGDGFGFVIKIVQYFDLNKTSVYSQIARELANQYNFKEINNLLKCINESGYENKDNSNEHDECISTCIRIFAAQSNNMNTYNSQQQLEYNKEIENLIKLIKNDDNKINAYILNNMLKSAYLIAVQTDKIDKVRQIANTAERLGQNSIRDICFKWLDKKQQSSK